MNEHGLILRSTKRFRKQKRHEDTRFDRLEKHMDGQRKASAEMAQELAAIKALLLHPSTQAKPE